MTANQINYWKQQEEARHNAATEYEERRSNKAKEEENYRSNTARENETYRHNFVSEQQNLFGLETQAGHYSQADLAALQQAAAAGAQAAASTVNAETNAYLAELRNQYQENEMEKFYADLAYRYNALQVNDQNQDQLLTQGYVKTAEQFASDVIGNLVRSGIINVKPSSKDDNNKGGSNGSGAAAYTDTGTGVRAYDPSTVFGVGTDVGNLAGTLGVLGALGAAAEMMFAFG